MAATFGPYRLVGLLGRGGMGEVWKAVDTSQDDRVVALKVLGAWLGGDAGFGDRFRREAKLAASLTCPNIIPIHRYGEVDGRLYIDMPLIDGRDLADLIKQDGPLPPERAVSIIEQVADALDVAHRAGMVHRDVKPPNILVTGRPGRDFAYLSDFGIARAADGTKITASGVGIGTPAYMAPEQFDGQGDRRADVYSLACVLHEALIGQPPFLRDSAAGLLKAHLLDEPPRPSALRAGVPHAMDDVIARGMAKNPDDRYPDAGALATAAIGTLVTAHGSVADRPVRRPDVTATRPNVNEHTIVGHTSAVMSVAIGWLDSRPIVVSGSRDGTVRIWDLATGASVGRPLAGHTQGVESVTFGQFDTRPVVVAGGLDSTVRLWDLATGAPVAQPLTGHTDGVEAVAVTSLDGRPVVVSGGNDYTVRVWDPTRRRPLTGHGAPVRAVAVAQVDGRQVIVSGGNDRVLRMWDLATRKRIGRPLMGHEAGVTSLAVARIGDRDVLVSGSGDRTVRPWNLATGAPAGPPLTGHDHAVNAVAAGPCHDRPVVVSGSSDGTVRLWDLASRRPIGRPMTGHSGIVRSVAVAQLDGRPVVVSGGDDGTVQVWDLAVRARA